MASRTAKLDLRLSTDAKKRLKAAATVSHQSVTQFVLASALARADEALLDRRVFTLDEAQWAAFTAALDSPPRDLPRLQRLMQEPGPFDPE